MFNNAAFKFKVPRYITLNIYPEIYDPEQIYPPAGIVQFIFKEGICLSLPRSSYESKNTIRTCRTNVKPKTSG